MTTEMSHIVVLKAADAGYEAAFVAADPSVHVHFVEVLSYEFVNRDLLQDAMRHVERYSGVIVTSPRGAGALVAAIQALEPAQAQRTLDALKDAVFSVGRATSRELEPIGVTCRGDESGSADALAVYLAQDGVLPEASATKPVLFVCGEKRRDALGQSFADRQAPFEELVAYQTCSVENVQLPDGCPDPPQWIVFFSPSGLKAVKDMGVHWDQVKKAAIGRITAHVMLACGYERRP